MICMRTGRGLAFWLRTVDYHETTRARSMGINSNICVATYKVEISSINAGVTRVAEQTAAAVFLRQPQVSLSLFFSVRAIPAAAFCCKREVEL